MSAPTTTESDLISLRCAAQRLNISLRGLYRLIANRTLPVPVKVGGSSKLFRSDIESYLESLKTSRR
jgi:excisionase family DNA binding protein